MDNTIPELPLDPTCEKALPVCPVCGAETDSFIVNARNDVMGCDCCLSTCDAWGYREETA